MKTGQCKAGASNRSTVEGALALFYKEFAYRPVSCVIACVTLFRDVVVLKRRALKQVTDNVRRQRKILRRANELLAAARYTIINESSKYFYWTTQCCFFLHKRTSMLSIILCTVCCQTHGRKVCRDNDIIYTTDLFQFI